MLRRQTSGSVVCPSCGKLVGVSDERCWSCGRRNPGMWGFAGALRNLGNDLGFTNLALGACVLLFLVTLLVGGMDSGGLLNLLSPRGESLFVFGASGAIPIFGYGRWWTLLSAGWLHGGLLHIAFNMYWLKQLGPTVAQLYGPGRAVIIYVLSSVAGFAASSFAGQYFGALPSFLHGAGLTVGASAAIFGWLGAMVFFGQRTGSTDLTRQILGFAIPIFIIGLLLPIMDNWAHVGGFGGGWLAARVLDPARPERGDHLLVALVLLALSALSILVSVLHGLRFLR